MRNVGILGGTFNPVHVGHLMIAEKAREQFHLDEVLFLPNGIPYMKVQKDVLPGNIRNEMIRLAIEDNPFFTLSTIESEKEEIAYTYETLLKLRDKNPNTDYYFIMGADNLWAVESWKEPAQIFANCHVLAAVRGDKNVSDLETQASFLQEKYHADISVLQTDHVDISSSMIRGLLKEGRSIRYLVPEAVYDYIIIHKLYCREK
ncbi:MAG: nicotinate-nucleotide adenylyltransferase [Ruminococcus sp.]|nr:nicotinate-nucleotide adenylyltransferase [Ruminococcus sp.]